MLTIQNFGLSSSSNFFRKQSSIPQNRYQLHKTNNFTYQFCNGKQLKLSTIKLQSQSSIEIEISQQPEWLSDDFKTDEIEIEQLDERQILPTIFAFALPALGTCIADPLMSLVDTGFVGRYTTAQSLAALAPSSLVFGLINNVFAAYGAALTSQVSKLFGSGQYRQAYKELEQALFIGSFGGIITLFLGWNLAKLLIQFTGANTLIVAEAMGYLRIRLFACPAVFCTMVVNSFLYAQFDAITALKLVVLNLCLNVIGDYWLVVHLGWGLKGAAFATVGAQFLGLVFILFVLRNRYEKQFLDRGENFAKQSEESEADESSTASQGFLLTTITVVKLLCYQMLSIAANGLQVQMIAAHQIVFSLFSFLTFVPVPLQHTSLVFIPQQKSKIAIKRMVVLMTKIGAYLGVILSFVSIFGSIGCMYFLTNDVTIRKFILCATIQSTLALALSCVDTVCESVLVVLRQQMYVLKSMTFTSIMMASYLYFGRQSQLINLEYIWWGYALFFTVRLLQSFLRVVYWFRQQNMEVQLTY
eukprot:TRINITY_DN4668_c0_g1_i8.p1 TRINITY_DN4668_c0_g1~~TRINITY_DN4668_c0_g1_i8.p1  ORF type:complete len:529 (-),score=44.45 TRINITY_DN4668_c0_g1_i8:191-1777(-)